MLKEICLPEISENVESGEITKVLVAVGDRVEVEQSVVEMDTDKANVEVPSPFAGTIAEIHVKEGDSVKIGQVIIRLEVEEATTSASEPVAEPPVEAISKPVLREQTPPVSFPLLVQVKQLAGSVPDTAPTLNQPAPAAPSVRRLARELGVEIDSVPGTTASGRISMDDVKAFAKAIILDAHDTSDRHLPQRELPDFTAWGEVERQPMNKVRQITAEGLTYSWVTIPHVTQVDKVDITALEEFRKQFKHEVELRGGKLTMTAILVKIVTEALKKFPQFNASVDIKAKEIVYKKYYHLGVAVDTDRGLLVPVIKNADQKSITELAIELTVLGEKTRSRKIHPDEMVGGTFTISNLGGIGGTAFTPIVYPPQVAILGVSKASTEPRYRDGVWEPRLVMPLMVSYDHRLIDGADGIRFLRWIAHALEQPMKLLL